MNQTGIYKLIAAFIIKFENDFGTVFHDISIFGVILKGFDDFVGKKTANDIEKIDKQIINWDDRLSFMYHKLRLAVGLEGNRFDEIIKLTNFVI